MLGILRRGGMNLHKARPTGPYDVDSGCLPGWTGILRPLVVGRCNNESWNFLRYSALSLGLWRGSPCLIESLHSLIPLLQGFYSLL